VAGNGKLAQLKRDLRMVVRGFVGQAPAPFHPRTRRNADGAKAHIPTRAVEVTEVVRETPDTTTLRFRGALPIQLEAGQFFTLLVNIDGQELRRAYSASSSALETDSASITVKRIPGGLVSNYVGDTAKVGAMLRLLGPSGSFTVPAAADHLVLIAGGSGITPMMSIIRTQLAARPTAQIDLLFGNRGEADIIFRQALDELAAAHPSRLRVRHTLEPSPLAHYFICGPEPMMDAAHASLSARTIPGARVHAERFTQPHRRTPGPARTSEAHQVRVQLQRDSRDVYVPPGETILEAALDAGLAMPFSCGLGGCGACRMRVLDGDVEMEEPNCLTEDEKRARWVLTCVGRPTCRTTIEAP